jgi:hypothetical protein
MSAVVAVAIGKTMATTGMAGFDPPNVGSKDGHRQYGLLIGRGGRLFAMNRDGSERFAGPRE